MSRPLCFVFIVSIACGNSAGAASRVDAGAGDPDAGAMDAGAMDAAEAPHDAAVASDAGHDAASRDAGSGVDAGEGCRSTAECSGGLLCFGPEESTCGIPPREECQSDGECGAGVCHAAPDSCSPDGIGSLCGPACSADSCGDGFVCASGHCRPTPCGKAFACSAAETCDASSIDESAAPHAITHGCLAIACDDDAPCPGATVCVNQRCQTALGSCSLPPP